jgi:hypothetical protein
VADDILGVINMNEKHNIAHQAKSIPLSHIYMRSLSLSLSLSLIFFVTEKYSSILQIQYHELMNFIQSTGICLQQRFLGYQRKDITGLFSFFDTLQNALLTNVKRVFVEVRELTSLISTPM